MSLSAPQRRLEDMGKTLDKEMEEDEDQHHKLACWCNSNSYEKDLRYVWGAIRGEVLLRFDQGRKRAPMRKGDYPSLGWIPPRRGRIQPTSVRPGRLGISMSSPGV